MKKLLFIITICSSLNVFSQDWSEFEAGIEKIISENYGKGITGKGLIDSLDRKQGKWTFNHSSKPELKYSEGTFLNNEKFGNWNTFYLRSSNREKTKGIYKEGRLFRLQYFDQVREKRIELISDSGLSKFSTIEIEKICHYQEAIIMEIMRKGYTPDDAVQKSMNVFSIILKENKEDAILKFWNYDLLASDIRLFNSGEVKQEVVEYYSKKPSKYIYFINGIKTEEKQLIENSPNHYQVTEFYPNGLKKSKSTFKDGKQIGIYKEWDEKGRLKLKKKQN